MQLCTQQMNKDTLVMKLMQDEVFQRDAFEVLFKAKDAKHKRLTDEVGIPVQVRIDLGPISLNFSFCDDHYTVC